MLKSGDIYEGEVIDFNRGGLLVEFGGLRGFVPGSHLWAPARQRFSRDKRKELFKEYIGEELALKVIEVDRDQRRLILSERRARREKRKLQRERLLEQLVEGQVVEGTVRRLTDFGAFVDLGGADGLIHVSELAWQFVEHPREVLDVGDKVKVYVLRLDHERKRIALSLKRLQPHPWDVVDKTYAEGQLVKGTVSGITDFGAFATLKTGIEGLIHISELSDPPPSHPKEVVQTGDELVLRILHIDPYRQRIGLSLRQVSEERREQWLAEHAEDQAANSEEEEAEASAETSLSDNGQVSAAEIEETAEVDDKEEATDASEPVNEEAPAEPMGV
jgi:small subunit ribosomal protein S1